MIRTRSIQQRAVAGAALISLAMLLGGAGAGGGRPPGHNERARLVREQRRLERRVAHLNQEQEFLRFQQVYQQSDSKYLILDLTRGRGQLKYRNRLLRSFRMTRAGGPRGRAHRGLITLSRKQDPYRAGRTLIFGKDLILQGPGGKRRYRSVRRYRLGAKDLAAITYVLEVGAHAYIVH